MRNRFRPPAWGLILVLALQCPSFARNVLVLPGGTPNPEVRVLSGALASLGSFTGSVGPTIRAFANPAGTKYYVISTSGSDTLIAVDQNLNRLLNYSPGSNGQGGVITPDGRRVLLLTVAGLYIFDSESLARLAGPIEVGEAPLDVAVSLDSRYAFVLSSNSRRLTRVDLGSNLVAGDLTIPGISTSVAAAPNGLLYVGATNRLYEIDGFSMTRTGEIALNGTPGRPVFTPDGRYALSLNTVAFAGSPTYWLFDLDARTATVAREAINFRDLLIVSDTRAIALAEDQRLYQISIPELALTGLTVYAVGQPVEVKAITASNESPAAKYLYYLNPLGVHRLDLATNRLNPETPAGVAGSPIGLAFAGAAATGSPARLVFYNQAQSIDSGGTFRPLVVRALDAEGRPLYNVPVTFTAGASGVTVTPSTANTNADGLALARVDAGSMTGRFSVTVQAGSVSGAFSLAVGTGTGVGRGLLQIKSGNGQVVREYGIAEPLTIVLRDAAGNPVANAPITWELIEGVGTLQGFQEFTDANGEATAQFIGAAVPPGLSYQQATIRASSGGDSVDFYITTVIAFLPGGSQPAPNPLVLLIRPEQGVFNIEGRAGQTITAAIEARVIVQAGIQFGQPIRNVGLTVSTGNQPGVGVTASCVGGTALSDESGVVKCDLQLGGVVGTATLTANVGNIAIYSFTLTVTPGLPARINKLQGDNQTGRPGQRLPLALVGEVTDAFGNRLTGVSTQWSVSPSGAATLSNVISASDLLGRTSALVTLGNTPGQVQITVSAGGASAVFTATIEAVAAQIRKVSGDNQTAVINQPFPAPLVVQLLDAQNQPVPNAVVGFAVSSGNATLSAPTATTDAQGNAQVTARAGASAGPIVITATFGSLPSVSFNLTARLPGPSLSLGAFVNGASGQPGLVPGSIVKIAAPGIAPAVRENCIEAPRVGPLPLTLAEVSVEFQGGGFSGFGPLYYVCNVAGEESAAVQVPTDLPVGSATVIVRAGGGSATIAGVPVLAIQPGIFEVVGTNGLRHGVLMRPDGSFVSQENKARRGEVVYLFATGLGAMNPRAPTNALGQGQTVVAPLVVGVNNEGVRVLRAEYAVNMIGVYVVAFEVPATTTPGPNRPLVLAAVQGDQLIFSNGSTIPIE